MLKGAIKMHWTLFHGSKTAKTASSAFSLLPTLIILFSMSLFFSALLALGKQELCATERRIINLEENLSESSKCVEEEWFNVAD